MRPNSRYLENIKTKFLYLCLFIRLSPLEILYLNQTKSSLTINLSAIQCFRYKSHDIIAIFFLSCHYNAIFMLLRQTYRKNLWQTKPYLQQINTRIACIRKKI